MGGGSWVGQKEASPSPLTWSPLSPWLDAATDADFGTNAEFAINDTTNISKLCVCVDGKTGSVLSSSSVLSPSFHTFVLPTPSPPLTPHHRLVIFPSAQY